MQVLLNASADCSVLSLGQFPYEDILMEPLGMLISDNTGRFHRSHDVSSDKRKG